jgi:hypothetical protein
LYGIKKYKSNENNLANYNKLGGIIERAERTGSATDGGSTRHNLG